jgi:zinc and cadmium transporter
MNSIFTSPTVLLAGYCVLALIAALAGGALPNLFRLTHTRLQVAVSFVAGLMLGLSLLGLLPHALGELAPVSRTMGWFLGGFLAMFFLQRFLPFHHHDVAEGNAAEPCGHPPALGEAASRSLSWMGVALGLSLHSVFDGLAMAAALASGAHGHGDALGLGTALAVILHKPFGALAIATLMTAGGAARRARHWVNLAFALVTPLGALLFYLGAGAWAHTHPACLGGALAFCAGTFLCIAGSDLLPELQFHAHDRVKLSLALLAGLGVAVAITRFGHPGHEHEAGQPVATSAPHTAERLTKCHATNHVPFMFVGSVESGKAQHVAPDQETKTKQTKERTVMKATTLVKSIVAAMLLTGSATVLLAQNAATPSCPFGHEPGYGRSLTPEQRAVQQAAMQQLVTELRAKRDAGTITAEESAWLAKVEQRGGKCIGGPNQGRGQGPRDGTGNQYRQGRKAGSPQAAVAPAEDRAPVLYAQGKGGGKGTGPKDGTGNKNGKGKKGGKGTGPQDGSGNKNGQGNKNGVISDNGVPTAA